MEKYDFIEIEKTDSHYREVLGAVVGLAKTCGNNTSTDETVKLMCDTLREINNKENIVDDKMHCGKKTAEQMLERLHGEKYNISPGCAVCQARCGNTDDYDIALILDEEPVKRGIKEKLIRGVTVMAEAAGRDSSLYADDEFRLVFTGALTVLSYDMSVKGLENGLEQVEKWSVEE